MLYLLYYLSARPIRTAITTLKGFFLMINIAILGFGVVGGGVAELLSNNKKQTLLAGGEEINIKYILDLRDFPSSPFADKIVHNFDVILEDGGIDCIIEVMGGSHPAYEYTVAALKKGISVITSNKEVVANFGDEFIRLAKDNNASYRFEAAVGGGIPVISPMISCIAHNEMKEVKGILNGTTNYILTKMFSFGESFESALKDAQDRGYAERNPDADVLGTDAARKITILAALATGKLVDVKLVHTEGITGIRLQDVKCAEALGMKIKLVGRCVVEDNGAFVAVAPFMLTSDSSLYSVSGVYNAVEVDAVPLGNVMFYGQGAGAGATASAVVGDLMQIARSGVHTRAAVMEKDNDFLLPFSDFVSRSYVALDMCDRAVISEIFGNVMFISSEGECAFITDEMKEGDILARISSLADKGISLRSRIRLL